MKKKKALFLETVHRNVIKSFEDQGYEVIYKTKSLSEQELIEIISDISVLGIRSKTPITREVLRHAKNLVTIITYTIGTDQIDLEACLEAGVAVFNAPTSSTNSVAELAICHTIALSRGIFDKSVKMHAGIWDKSSIGSTEIDGKTLGIIGCGNIGRSLSKKAKALGMKVAYYDIDRNKKPIGKAKRCSSLEELLSISDVVTLHVDGSKKNTNMMSTEQFALMKDGAIFINLSRGHVVNILALVEALKNGKLRGAAIDVFPNEPNNGEPFESPLQGLPNVILTPHIGGSTEEAQRRIEHFASGQGISYLNDGETSNSVNFPKLNLEKVEGEKQRIAYLHSNVPGAVAPISNILAKYGINIVAERLAIKHDAGYKIFCVNNTVSKKALKELNSMKGAKGALSLRII